MKSVGRRYGKPGISITRTGKCGTGDQSKGRSRMVQFIKNNISDLLFCVGSLCLLAGTIINIIKEANK